MLTYAGRGAWWIAAVVSAALLGGCSPEIKAESCVKAESIDHLDRVPDLTKPVACDQGHVYEIYDIANVPSAALSTSADNREELAIPSEFRGYTPRRRAYETFSQRRCSRSLLRETGYDNLTVNGKPAAQVRLLPAFRGIEAPWNSLVPEKQWQGGQRQFVCSARFSKVARSGANLPALQFVAAPGHGLLLSLARENQFPLELRPCRTYNRDRTGTVVVPCQIPHVAELLFYFEAEKAMGKEFVTVLAKHPTAARMDKLSDVCARTISQLTGGKLDKRLRGIAVVPRTWTPHQTPVRCEVSTKKFRTKALPGGSLVGVGRAPIKLLTVKPAMPGKSK